MRAQVFFHPVVVLWWILIFTLTLQWFDFIRSVSTWQQHRKKQVNILIPFLSELDVETKIEIYVRSIVKSTFLLMYLDS